MSTVLVTGGSGFIGVHTILQLLAGGHYRHQQGKPYVYAAGGPGSFDCSGDEIGQFQFFDSESKAASTTQLLTELRSSRVVEDNGDRIVGWSTLGTSAIITVVDNRAGQVLQQLVSSDQEDPRQRIYDLGLATR